ncbi:KEOPS complex subunit Pcc1 [Salinilacihabitans rarus]|uniref:KEOPS complex subunit Pcc1 n=1 Tax=Salinilacihabitans rarus TaxID=2961596 RepID=UPI0020C89521|nr:KEOPS complex subunit Pcc1 [Salinilacihabitans rarus]
MTRRATIRTSHDDPARIAAAIAPDNTDEMETRVEDGAVVTRIERRTTGGLHSTVDDYVVNLDVATDVAQHANEPMDANASDPIDESKNDDE